MTINATGNESAWQRQCLIEVTSAASKIMKMEALTETIDIDLGERDLDKIDLCNLGQIPKHGSMGITTVTIEGYPKQAGSAAAGAATGFFDIFASNAVIDASQPLDIDMSNTLTRYRVAVLWTNDTAADDASDAIADTKESIRFVMAECFCVSCKSDFTDGVLKQILVFKGLAFDTTGATTGGNNIKMESTDSSSHGGLSALGNYVAGTTKWAA